MCGNPSVSIICAKISLNVGGTYIQRLYELGPLIEEIREGQIGEVWTVEIVEMDEKEYESLPEFIGH
jgi:hypothetical protein